MNSTQLQELRDNVVGLLDTDIDNLSAQENAFQQSIKESAARSKEGIQKALDWFLIEHLDETQTIEMFRRSLKNQEEIIQAM